MGKQVSRRTFVKLGAAGAAGWIAAKTSAKTGVGRLAHAATREYGISLAGWSLHRTIGTKEGQVPMLDMPMLSREEFDIEAIELVNRMLASTDKAYIDRFIKNAAAHNVKILLIMIDVEGNVGAESETDREEAVERHKKWIDIAADMGCHTVRMNWAGYSRDIMEHPGALQEYIDRSVSPFRKICDYGDKKNIDVIVENHGGPSSYPDALIPLIEKVDHERFGTLPDFGNFPAEVDNYDAIDRMMPYAKAVSAKCYDFDDETGLETKLDFERIIANVVDKHGYHGYIGIEYEGNRLSEFDGIRAAKKLLEKLRG